MLVALALAPAASAQVVEGGGLVVAENATGAAVGARVLADGGNAVDAAIATAFAMAVTRPSAGNIGGGGFLVFRGADGTTTSFDFRERAPAAATERMFLDDRGVYSSDRHHRSHLAVGVPGTVAGLWLAHRRLGSRPWAELVAPAIALARNGIPVTPWLASALREVRDDMARYPETRRIFSRPDGEPFAPGDLLRQPDLAVTLERIRDRGADGFYRGETARLLVAEMERGGGLITRADLESYAAVERPCVTGRYRGHTIIGMGPPSSGGTVLIEMLGMLEAFPIEREPAARLHLLAEVMRRGFADRARVLGDPSTVDRDELARLLDPEHARRRAADIDPVRASRSRIEDFSWTKGESDETTHFSVVDGAGNAVALTYTLEYGFGSRIVVPGAGFLLNNEMGDFNPKPGHTDERGFIGSSPNLVAPGKRMLSSMSPTIVVDSRGRLRAILGARGGRTIINTVLQTLLGIVDLRMSAADAVALPRIHHQWFPDELLVESTLDEPLRRALEGMGHRIRVRSGEGANPGIGAVECIRLRPSGRRLIADPGVDPRSSEGGSARPRRS